MGREFSRRRFMTGALAGGVGMKLGVAHPDGGVSETLEAEPASAGFSAPPPASQGGRWWEQQPLTILDLHTFAGEITRFPAPELAQLKAPLGFNTDTLYVHNLFDGMDDQGFFFRTALAAKENPDYLKEFLPEARKRGMRTTLYFNVHYYTMEFAQKHPDWVQVREGGRTLDELYGHGTTLCVNSPWRDWVAALMKDLCAYPIDGIFVDGPAFFPETCYCHWCQEKFRRLHGRDLPSKCERQGPAASQLLEFQGASLAEFMRDINRVIKSANPNILLYGNHTALTGNWASGQVNRRLVKEQDLLASEGGYVYNDLNQTPLWKAGLRARMIETQAGGKPTVIIACPALKPWTHAMLPAACSRHSKHRCTMNTASAGRSSRCGRYWAFPVTARSPGRAPTTLCVWCRKTHWRRGCRSRWCSRPSITPASAPMGQRWWFATSKNGSGRTGRFRRCRRNRR